MLRQGQSLVHSLKGRGCDEYSSRRWILSAVWMQHVLLHKWDTSPTKYVSLLSPRSGRVHCCRREKGWEKEGKSDKAQLGKVRENTQGLNLWRIELEAIFTVLIQVLARGKRGFWFLFSSLLLIFSVPVLARMSLLFTEKTLFMYPLSLWQTVWPRTTYRRKGCQPTFERSQDRKSIETWSRNRGGTG